MKNWFDGLLLFLLPAVLNSAALTGGAAPRATASILFLIGIFRHLIFLPAASISLQTRLDEGSRRVVSKSNPLLWALLIFLLLYVVAEFRGVFAGVEFFGSAIGFMVWSGSALLYFVLLSSVVTNAEERGFLLKCLMAGTAAFSLVNFAGYALGRKGVSELDIEGPNKILSMIGLTKSRVLFPFTNGLNNFAVLNSLLLAGSTGGYLSTEKFLPKLGLFACIGIALAALVLVDSRMALLASIGGIYITLYAGRRVRVTIFKWLPPFLLVAPLLVIAATSAIHYLGFESLIQREGAFAAKLGLASGRDTIWGAVYDEMATLKPIHWIGFGLNGQMTSGITKEFSWIFSEAFGMTSASVHDAILQVFMDIGYIGVAVWVILLWLFTRGMIRLEGANELIGEKRDRAYLAIALTIIFYGITEVAGLPYQPDVFILFLLVVCLIGFDSRFMAPINLFAIKTREPVFRADASSGVIK